MDEKLHIWDHTTRVFFISPLVSKMGHLVVYIFIAKKNYFVETGIIIIFEITSRDQDK